MVPCCMPEKVVGFISDAHNSLTHHESHHIYHITLTSSLYLILTLFLLKDDLELFIYFLNNYRSHVSILLGYFQVYPCKYSI